MGCAHSSLGNSLAPGRWSLQSWIPCPFHNKIMFYVDWNLSAAWLAQLVERRSAERDVVAGSNPGWTNTQGL